MIDFPIINTPDELADHLKGLRAERKSRKRKAPRKYRLSIDERKAILNKTNSICHICGGAVTMKNFEADHVQVHSSSVNNRIDNFLPACRICNNYRWFYEPEEIKWILKLGVWLKTKIEKDTPIGKAAASLFAKHENRRRARRKTN